MFMCANTYAACEYIVSKPNILTFKIKVFLEGSMGGGSVAPTNRDRVPPLAIEQVDTTVSETSIASFVHLPADFNQVGGTEKVSMSAYNDENNRIANCLIALSSTQTITLTDLLEDRRYRLEFFSKDAAGNISTTPLVIYATPMDTTPPTLLGNIDISLTLNLNQYDTDFTWPQSNAEDLSYYKVEVQKSEELVLSATILETNYSAVFPSNGEYISITVYAVDDDGLLSEPLTASTQLLDVVPPLPVRDVVAQAGDRVINISWVNPSDTGSPGGTNMIQVSLSEGSTVTQSVSFTEPLPTEHQFGALQNNVLYGVTLTTFDATGNTTSVSVSATPMDTIPPTLLGNIDISLTLNLNQYDTDFTWPQSNADDLSYYKIEIQKSDELVLSTTTLETNYSTVFPSNGEYISITVYAVDDDGLLSDPLTASTQLLDVVPPTLLGSIDISLTLDFDQYDTDFAWTQSDADDLSHYIVEIRKSGELVLSATTLETNYSAVFPSNGEYISITVYAVDDNGLLSVPLTASTQLLDVVPPLPVRDVVAQAGDRVINVSWVNPSDIGSEGGTNMVKVSLSEESSVIQSASFTEPVPTEYQFGALQNNVPYDVVLTTFDEAGNTTSVSVSATPMDTIPPSAPRRVEFSLTESEELSTTAVLEVYVFADQTADDITHNHILVMQGTSTLVNALYDPTADINIEIQQDGSTVLVVVSHIDDDNNESNVTSVSIQTENLTPQG